MSWPLLLSTWVYRAWGSILRVMQKVCDAGLPESKFLGCDTDLCINIYRNGSETVFDDGIVTGLRRDSGLGDAIMTRFEF